MKITVLPDAPWRHRKGFDDLCARLGAGEGMVRIVGGAVRDCLLALEVSDIDLATILQPEEVTRRLTGAGIKVVPTGIVHGTVTAVIDGRPVEITTLRCDVSTDGRRATIAYTEDWQADAARRDFTINALYADPITGAIFDYFDGIEDLSRRRVRFIGEPEHRIAEDHLRILRYFRFLARFGTLPPDSSAYRACVARANSLMALSRERIADELLKLLALPSPGPVLRLMIEGGILAPILPEANMDGLARLETLLDSERAAGITSPSPLIRFAALLPPDPDLAAQVAARLKLSNKARRRIVAALTPPAKDASIYERAFRCGREAVFDQLLLSGDASAPTDIHALADWKIPDFPIGGRDLLELGVKAGPAVSRLLGKIRDRWIAEEFPAHGRVQQIAERYVSEFLRDSQNL